MEHPVVNPTLESICARPGNFIVVEGPEGSGKTTLVKELAARFRDAGVSVFQFQQPGTTPVGNAVRKLLTEQHFLLHADVKLRLLEAARLDGMLHFANEVADCRRNGVPCVVLGDRHIESTFALQVGFKGASRMEALAMHRDYHKVFPTKITIYLDCPSEVSYQRVQGLPVGEKKMFDLCSPAEFEQIRMHYLDQVTNFRDRYFVVDTSTTIRDSLVQLNPLVESLINTFQLESQIK